MRAIRIGGRGREHDIEPYIEPYTGSMENQYESVT